MKKQSLLPIIVLSLLTSCGQKSSGVEYKLNDSTKASVSSSSPVTYAQIKSEILAPHCLSCHSDAGTEDGLLKWITPGDPNASSFFTEVESGGMPKNQTPLDTASLELIRTYIEQMAMTPSTLPTTSSPAGTTPSTDEPTDSSSEQPSVDPAPAPTHATITYEQIKSNVLTPYRCLNCHSVGSETKLAKWINKSSPSSSLLYTTIRSGSMPQGGPRVSTDVQQLVLQYVKDFANR